MNKIKLSEEQNMMIQNIVNEMLNNNTNLSYKYDNPNGTPKNAGDIGKAAIDASKKLETTPKNPMVNNKVSFSADPDNDGKQQQITIGSDSTNESILITKKQLNEARLKKMKENTKVVKLKNLFR